MIVQCFLFRSRDPVAKGNLQSFFSQVSTIESIKCLYIYKKIERKERAFIKLISTN